MNLSANKLRRTATVIGGSIVGLGLIAAFATPALACSAEIQPFADCATDNSGNWNAAWTVSSDYAKDVPIKAIKLDGESVNAVGDIQVGKAISKGTWLHGTNVETAGTAQSTLQIQFEGFRWGNPKTVNQPEGGCHTTPETTPATTPETTPATTPGTTPETPAPTETPTVPTPSTSTSVGEPKPIGSQTCSSITFGLDNPSNGIEWLLHVAVKQGAKQTVKDLDIKPGEKKTATFPVSAGKKFTMTLGLAYVINGTPHKAGPSQTITGDLGKECTKGSASPSASGPVLAITGSSSTPIAGGAIALVLAGGGAFFLARRRKMKFTA